MQARRVRAVFVLPLCLAMVSCHMGQRYLTFEIEVDEKVVLAGHRGVPDDTPVDEMWDRLDDISFDVPEDSTSELEAAAGQSLTLDGNVVVRIRHVDRELSRAAVSSLTLTRDTPSSAWTLSESDLEQFQRANAE